MFAFLLMSSQNVLLLVSLMELLTTLFFSWHVKREKGWQTIKRPGVDAFLEHLAQYFEIIVYSDYSNMVI